MSLSREFEYHSRNTSRSYPYKRGKLTDMLQSIVDSAKRSSTLLYAPGELHLPILGVTVSLSQGTWGIGKTINPATGPIDLLIRTGGVAELKVMPVILGGRCSEAMNPATQMKNPPSSAVSMQLLKNPPFISSGWEPSAIKLNLPHESVVGILITVCRQISQTKTLQVNLSYGSEEIPQSDVPLISMALDEIAAGVLKIQE